MKKFLSMLLTLVMILAFAAPLGTLNAAAANGRYMEYLDRGVVAVRNGNSVFVSWRLLASDDPSVGFNVYRTTDGVTVKLNNEPLYGGTNFTDTTANLSKNNSYFVKTVLRGVERDTDGDYTIPANSVSQAITIPIKSGGTIHFVWVGDFNADGKYDFLLDRLWGSTQKLEAYLHDGTYLWTIDLGYNSTNTDNIEPGPSTIDVGMWDGATVYDIDCDGSAEVLLRVADGVILGDGSKYSNSTTNGQAIAVINGMTGKMETSAPVPNDMISAGPKACMMEIGYLDGVNPSLVCWLKNRNDNKTFNSYMVAYGYVNGQFKQQWKFNNNKGYAEAHNIRIADVDYDGRDEVLHMGYALNGDGSLRYTVDKVVHGDRWYVGSFSNSNNNNEMMGYGIQQDNASGLLEYFYNASTGKLIWTHYAASGTADVARGNVGDVDPNYDGFECWSFQGLYSMNNQKISDGSLYPVLRLWWDGDLLSESFNDGKIEEWDYNNKWTNRVLTTWNVTDCVRSDRGVPMFYGDILGDWREEFIMTSGDYSKLVIFSTTIPTDYRLYCLAQNPCYRNCMTGKGYYQSHMLDYFLGHNMEMPETEGAAVSDEIIDGAVYMIKNANSNLYLDVTGGAAADGTNVQQWGATYPGGAYNNWKIVSAGDGYYQIYSMLGDGNTYVLDISGTKSANGTNVIIWTNKKNNGQYFKLEDNGDGTYSILTKVTGGASGLDVYDSSTASGGNVVQWKNYGSKNQKWILELVSEPSKYVTQSVTYTISDENGVVDSWTEKGDFEVEHTLYDFPAGESYFEGNGNAYIVSSNTEQKYVVTRDGETKHNVELELVRKNAVLADTFADVNANVNDGSSEMLFVAASGISDADDVDSNGNATVTGEGWSLGNPRVPLLTFNVPEDYVKGSKVKLNVYVGYAHTNLGGGNSMKLAVNKVDLNVNESAGYDADNIANLSNLVWSDNMFRLPNGSKDVNTWVSFDVTKFVENASGKVTFALYAPRAGAYIADRESASAGGAYLGKAAYLEVEEPEKVTKKINYVITDNGNTVASWTEATGEYSIGEVLYDIPAGEFYYSYNGKAYVVKSDEQKYVVADDGVVEQRVEYEVVNRNAVLADTFATVDGAAMNKAADMLFAGAASVADAADTDADGVSTMTGGLNVGNPRVPLITFNVPEDYEEGKAVKLNVYVAKVNHNFIQETEGAMKLAVKAVDTDVNENAGYSAADYAYADNAVWSDDFMTIAANATAVDQKVDVNNWLTFDVTEFVQNAGDKVTFALYAPTAGVYVVDRENAVQGGAYEGKAAYLEVTDGEVINTNGIEKVTKNGSVVNNPESFVVPVDAMVKFYNSTGAYAVTNGRETFKLTDGVTDAIDVAEGNYYLINFGADDVIYSTEGFDTLSYDTVVNGTIDMDIMPLEVNDNVIGITAADSNPTWYDQFNIVIGFRPEGTIKAYNATELDSETEIKYEAGKIYHLRIKTNAAENTFSAWITDGDNEYTLATDYAYRKSAPAADNLGKLTVLGGWNIGGGKLAVANVEFVNESIDKEVKYVITGEDGTAIEWTEYFEDCSVGDVLYNIPAGEYYYEHDGKAYVVRSEEQTYAVENDGVVTHTVELELVYNNAVIADTFATVDGAASNNAAEMLFTASAGVSDADDVDADGNETVTGEGWNLGNPRIPLLTFNVPEEYEEGMAVKLNVYAASAHTHLGKNNTMKLAAGSVDFAVDENENYLTDEIADMSSLVWSDNMVGYTSNDAAVNEWVTIDVTEFVQNADGQFTVALYAPRAALYVVDRESAMKNGAYEGMAAYLEVTEGETITTEGMEKVTKNGSVVNNPESFVVPVDATIVFYSEAYAVTNGSEVFEFVNGKTDAIDVESGEYYAIERIYSTEGFEALEYDAITNGTIDMVLMPYEVTDNVVGITASDSNPTWYDQFNIVVRFKPDGTMDAYNGTVIESYENVSYEAGSKYYLHIETDVEAGIYSAWITDESGNEYTLALDYAYRASAPKANDLGKVTLIGGWEIGGEKFAAADIKFAE